MWSVTEGGSAVPGLRSPRLLNSSWIRVLIHKRFSYPTTESRRNSGRLFSFILVQLFKSEQTLTKTRKRLGQRQQSRMQNIRGSRICHFLGSRWSAGEVSQLWSLYMRCLFWSVISERVARSVCAIDWRAALSVREPFCCVVMSRCLSSSFKSTQTRFLHSDSFTLGLFIGRWALQVT